MTTTADAERSRRSTLALVAHALLGEVASVLARRSIPIMPLKGVLLQHLVYDDPAERTLTDVDVAVRSIDFDAARAALAAAGFRVEHTEPGLYGMALSLPPFPLCVDLHQRFTASRRYRLTPDMMFTRARWDDALFGFTVALPDDHDLYCHLLAHSTLAFVLAGRWHRPEDLTRVARRRKADVETCARRLDDHGLGRFARVALAQGTPAGDDGFGQLVRARLTRDRVGDAIAAAVLATCRQDRAPLALRRVGGTMLNPTLFDVGRAMLEAGVSRLTLDD